VRIAKAGEYRFPHSHPRDDSERKTLLRKVLPSAHTEPPCVSMRADAQEPHPSPLLSHGFFRSL
jgi:hypothetical protein